MAEMSIVSYPSKTITDNNDLTKSEKFPKAAFYQDFPLNGFINFTEKTRKLSVSPEKTRPTSSDILSDENEKRKLAEEKKRIFPKSVEFSCSADVAEKLRNERRQEFCPIYKDEPVDEKQIKRKRVGSLLPKRIRWDDLRRKREQQQYIHHDTVYNPDVNSNPMFSSRYSFEQNFRQLPEHQEWVNQMITTFYRSYASFFS